MSIFNTSEAGRPLRIVVLCNYSTAQGAVVVDSVNALFKYSVNEVFVYSSRLQEFDTNFPFELFDVVVIHYSVIPTLAGFISNAVSQRIAELNACKVMMAQDEYRLTDRLVEYANQIKVDYFFTVVPEHSAKELYARLHPGCKLVTYLTGYASHSLSVTRVLPMHRRKIDLVYRGREYPSWFGAIMKLKIDMALKLKKHPAFSDLNTNISVKERDRVYGIAWVNLLSKSKATFATESDVEVVDAHGQMLYWDMAFTDLVGKKIKAENEHLVRARSAEYTKPFPGSLSVIAPRIFEAISLRTVLVMPPGDYSGILVPWRHYIPLETDFSNIKEVVDTLKNNIKLAEIAATAYTEIAKNRKYTYEGFAELFDQTLRSYRVNRNKVDISSINTKDSIHSQNKHPQLAWDECLNLLKDKYPFREIENPHAVFVPGLIITTVKNYLASFVIFRRFLNLFFGSRKGK